MKKLFFILLLSLTGVIQALPMLMSRSAQEAEVTMQILQETLEKYGYTIAHVQRCDGGLSEFDYKTDFYQVVFFGRVEEVRSLTAKYPEMVPFLPLKIAVFAEGKETILTAFNPVDLSVFFDDPVVNKQLLNWATDISAIFSEVQLTK